MFESDSPVKVTVIYFIEANVKQLFPIKPEAVVIFTGY